MLADISLGLFGDQAEEFRVTSLIGQGVRDRLC